MPKKTANSLTSQNPSDSFRYLFKNIKEVKYYQIIGLDKDLNEMVRTEYINIDTEITFDKNEDPIKVSK